MGVSLWIRAVPLFGFSFVEITVSFLRALILTRFLGPYEFGFASAISLTFATAVLITDMGVHRFVLSARRSEFVETIAAAHAITILRSFLIAVGVFIASFPLSCTFASCSDWTSFAWLAPIMLIAAFEHLEIRISERDYRYWPQFSASLISHGMGLIALVVTAYETETHYAFLAYLFIQVVTYVSISHLLALNAYRPRFKSPQFQKAIKFGLPLTLNGIGLAVIGQGDRFMVGALSGLEKLGVYTVLLLAGILPVSALLKILNPLLFAGLHNARDKNQYASRVQLFVRAIPMIAGCYALTLIALLKTLLPFVFGSRYAISDSIVALLAMIAFFRIIRIEPGTSLLLHANSTGRLAIANISLAAGLLIATALVVVYRSIEAALFGGLIGEFVGLGVMILVTRNMLKGAIVDYIVAIVSVLSIVVASCWLVMDTTLGEILPYRIVIVSAFFALILAGAVLFLRRSYGRAYNNSASHSTVFDLPTSKVAEINAQLPKATDGSWN